MRGWERDKQRADIFMPVIAGILGRTFIRAGTPVEDKLENTDLRLFVLKPMRVAVRMRNDRDRERYGDEFTIRAGRPSGVDTEYQKLMGGWADYFFYGWGNYSTGQITQYAVLDLSVFRREVAGWDSRCFASLTRHLYNKDHSSDFYAWNIGDFPAELVVHRYVRSNAA